MLSSRSLHLLSTMENLQAAIYTDYAFVQYESEEVILPL